MQKYKTITVISLVLLAIVAYSCKTKFETTKENYTTVQSPEAFEKGKTLVFSICAGCHYNRSVNKFIGNKIEDVPGIAGTVYSANLTHSKTHGVMVHYSDAEIKHLLKTGVAKDGIFKSYMLRPNMADDDINDIIVYLRSDDPAVATADTTVGLTHYSFIGKMYMNGAAKEIPYVPVAHRPTEPVALGAYLVDNLGCFHCHSKSLTKLDYLHPDQSKGYLAGGIKLKGEPGHDKYASNITPDKNTGIGDYTQQQFRKAIKEGEAPDRKLHAPMPKFERLSDTEVDAIFAYIQTVPAKNNKVKED